MINCHELSQNIEKTIKTENPVSLSLYNYVRHYQSPAEDFNLNVLDAYFKRLLSFEFWQKEISSLQYQIRRYLGQLTSIESCAKLSKSIFLQNPQLITINERRDWLPIVEAYAQSKDANFKIHTSKNEIYVQYFLKGGHQAMQILKNTCFLHNGKIKPLTTDEIIYFDDQFELAPFQKNHIMVAPYQYTHFEKSYKSIKIKTFRGYSLQCIENTELQNIQGASKLYYAIKRFEALIGGKENHQLYSELTDLLEKALNLVHSNHPEAVQLAFTALERGKNAVLNIFPEDKLLRLLIRELALHLERKLESRPSYGDSTQ